MSKVNKVNKPGVAIAAVLLLALFLRLLKLGSESFLGDEGFSIRLAQVSLPDLIAKGVNDPSPPLYYALLHYWTRFLAGYSEIPVRSLSVVFGFLAIPLIYLVGVRLFNWRTGLIASFIMAISAFQIEYAQTARAYSLMVCLTLLSFYFFLKIFSEHGWPSRVAYVASTSLLMYSHAYGLFIVAAQFFYALILFIRARNHEEDRGERIAFRGWFSLQIILAFLYIPAAIQLTLQVTGGGNISWVPVPSNTAVLEALITYSGSLPLFLIFVLLAAFAVIMMARLERGNLILLALWLLFPLLVPFVVSKLFTPIFIDRDAIAATPALYLLAARGVDNLGFLRNVSSGAVARVSLVAAVAVISVFSMPVLFNHFTTSQNDEWRPAVQFIQKSARSGDVVITSPSPSLPNAYNLYSDRQDLQKIPFPIYSSRNITPRDVEDLQSELQGEDRVWFIFSKNTADPQLLENDLKQSYEITTRKSYRGIQLRLFERPSNSG